MRINESVIKNALGLLGEWHCWKWGQGWHLQIEVTSRPHNRLWGNIEKAKELLLNTNLGQAGISEKVGYSSEFHFSRKFKEIVGMSPNKFRKSS